MFYVVEKIFEPICVVLEHLWFHLLWQGWQFTHIWFELDNLGIIFGVGRLAWPTIMRSGVLAFLWVVHPHGYGGASKLFTVRELRGPLLDILKFTFRIQDRDRLQNWYDTLYEQRTSWTTTQLKNDSPRLPLQCLYRKICRALDPNSMLFPAGFHPWWSWSCIWQASKERVAGPI